MQNRAINKYPITTASISPEPNSGAMLVIIFVELTSSELYVEFTVVAFVRVSVIGRSVWEVLLTANVTFAIMARGSGRKRAVTASHRTTG